MRRPTTLCPGRMRQDTTVDEPAMRRTDVARKIRGESLDRSSGFILVELLVIGVVVSIVGVITIVLAQSGQQMWMITGARLNAMTSAQQAINRLTEDLRRASGQSVSAAACAETGLSFQPLNDDGSIGPTVTYARNGTQLIRTVGSQPPQIEVVGVVAFRPECRSGGVVALEVTTQASNGSRNALSTVKSRVWIQNP